MLAAGWTSRPPSPSSFPTTSCCGCGRTLARRTASRGTCSPRSTRSSRTSAGTWGRARPARSAGCSSCPRPGCAGEPTRTANGVADPWNPVDAVYSAARYLAASGGGTDIRRAVFSYNHADWYVNEVLQLAQLYGSSTLPPRMRTRTSRRAGPVVRARPAAGRSWTTRARRSRRRATRTRRARQGPGARRARAGADRRADAPPLLSDRLDAQKRRRAGRGRRDRRAGRGRSAEAEARRGARRSWPSSRQQARARRSTRPADPSGARSAGSGNYVFPVGGGPSVVSVSHYHHDYPAADIAAPEGSPLYALSDGTVLYAWS